MAEIITTLHPDGDENTNLYPNIKKQNIPSNSISTDKLDGNVLSLIGSLKPSGTDTSTNILAYTSNKGIYVATDNGHWYYWNGNKYANGGVYQAAEIPSRSITPYKTTFLVSPNVYDFSNYNDQTISSSFNMCTDFDFKENTQYTFTCNSTFISASGSSNIVAYLKFYYTDGSDTGWKHQICMSGLNNALKSYTSESGKTIKYINITTAGGIVFKMNNIRLNEGTTDLGYKYDFTEDINIDGTRKKIYIGSNRDFTTLTEGFLYAYNLGNCDVYIDGETFDLVSEYNLLPSRYYQGIPIGNNNRYYFSSKSKVTFNYTGNDTSIMAEYSPFMSAVGYGNFEIYNLNVECSKCRYCIHDENGSGTDATPYIHKYINCTMKIDNTNNPNSALYHCIGGGLGISGCIEIDGCYFNSVYVGTGGGDLSYHGNFSSTELAQSGHSRLFIRNNYFTHKPEFNSPNPESAKKFVMISNNSLGSNFTYNQDYWDVISFNNTIR